MNHLFVWRSLIAGWVSLLVAMAVDYFIIPHNPPYASEIGLPTAFVFFGGIFSLYFLADFLLLVVPCFLYLKKRGRPVRRWRWVAVGVVLFVASVPFWSLVSNHWVVSDVIYGSVLGGISGFVSFHLLIGKTHGAKIPRE
jgi:hypothetical protein